MICHILNMVDGEVDPLFEEVCEGEFYYVPVFSQRGGDRPEKWMVLARRKGYEKLRFGKEQNQ